MELILRITALVIFIICALAIWATDTSTPDVLGLGFVGFAAWVGAELVGPIRART